MNEPLHTFEDWRSCGLLWLINVSIFHPRGFAVGFAYPDDADQEAVRRHEVQPTGWCLLGDGGEPWSFSGGLSDDAFRAVEALFRGARGGLPIGRLPIGEASS